MHCYRMKMISGEKEAVVLASDKATAILLYRGKFGHDPEFAMQLDCSGTEFIMEEKKE